MIETSTIAAQGTMQVSNEAIRTSDCFPLSYARAPSQPPARSWRSSYLRLFGMPVQGHEVRKEEEGKGIKYGSGRGGETRPTRNKRHTRAGRRQVVLLWFARYFAASAFGFAIIWLLGLTIKRFFYMEQNVFGQRQASGQWGCFVLSRNGASCFLCAARCCFCFHPCVAANQGPHWGGGNELHALSPAWNDTTEWKLNGLTALI